MYVSVGVYVAKTMCEGQFLGVGSLLPRQDPGIEFRSLSLHGKLFCLVSHLTASVLKVLMMQPEAEVVFFADSKREYNWLSCQSSLQGLCLLFYDECLKLMLAITILTCNFGLLLQVVLDFAADRHRNWLGQ